MVLTQFSITKAASPAVSALGYVVEARWGQMHLYIESTNLSSMIFSSNTHLSVIQGERALFMESHRNCFGWVDEWFGMTMQQICELEQEGDCLLNEVRLLSLLVLIDRSLINNKK